MSDRDDDAPGRAGPAHDPPADGEPGDDWGDVQIGRWQSGPPPRPAAGFAGVGPKGWRRPDARIEEELCDGLTADAAIDPSDVTIGVRGGAVTLEGEVADADTRRRIAERAWGVAGVREVHNRLRVAGAGPPAPHGMPGQSTGEEGASMKATDVLRKQHREVLGTFKEIERSDDPNERRRLLDTVTEALRVHSELEEELFYPAIRATGTKRAEELVLRAFEEHHAVDLLLAETPDVDPEAENFDAKMNVLRELVSHHIEEEERDLFKLASKLDDEEAEELGRRLEAQSSSGH